MRTVAIVQARMDSKRLPGKVLLPVPSDGAMAEHSPPGQPMLSFLMDRLSDVVVSGLVDQVVMATTSRVCDRRIRTTTRNAGYDCWSDNLPVGDVLGRYGHAAREFGADTIVRITADCPLLCPTVVMGALCFYEWHQALGTQYVYTSQDWPNGMDVEVFSREALELADRKAETMEDREHVTLWMRRSLVMARARAELPCPGLWGDVRLTLDTPQDYEVICGLLRQLGPDCRLRHLVTASATSRPSCSQSATAAAV